MSQFFGKVKTKLDLNGPTLEFTTQPVSVATTGVGVGTTGGPDVTMSGIATVGFINFDTPPPCIAVIDENTGSSQSSVDQDWNNFYAAHPNRKFYLMDVGGTYGEQTVKTPTGIGTGAAPITNFTKFNVNRDDGNIAYTSDWFDLAGISTGQGYSLVTLWVDSSGSMTPSNVQASLDLFLTNCSNAGITVTQSPDPNAYFEEYIEPFITELTGPPSPTNKGSIGYQWYESGLGKLVEGDKYVGTATTTLTIKNIITPTDNDKKYYLEADYIPGQPGARTGNALNEPLNSGIATVTVTPILDIISQPATTAALQNIDATFSISAQLTNNTTGGVSYQWQIDEENITDGDITNDDTFVSITLEDQGLSSTQPSPYGQAVGKGEYFIPTDATNVVIDLASGPGGNSGTGLPPTDFGTPGKGGDGINQVFTPVSGSANVGPRKIRFIKGRRGGDGDIADTPDGLINGGSGARAGGSSGTNINFGASQGNHGGGGGGSTTFEIMYHNKETDVWAVVFAACLGGGGGGGAPGKLFQTPNNGQDGEDSNHIGVTGNALNNQSKGGDGEGEAGSGGGGGGYSGDTGQSANGGEGTNSRGGGGQDGRSAYRLDVLQNITGSLAGAQNTGGAGEGAYLPVPSSSYTDGWGRLTYNSVSATSGSSETITVSGTQTPTLTIRSNLALTRRIRCVVSHISEDIPDVISNSVNFICQSTAETSNINIEIIPASVSEAAFGDVGVLSINSEHDLNDGEYTFDTVPVSSSSTLLYYCFYSPDKDIDIEMDLYGGMGLNVTSINGTQNLGGQGGYSRIRFTLEKNTEYIISGLNNIVKAPFVYKKASLIACVGGGGDAGVAMNADGGAGGGVGADGADGEVWGGGGGKGADETNLSTSGVYGSLFQDIHTTGSYAASIYAVPTPYPGDSFALNNDGGKALSCPKGVWWAEVWTGSSCTNFNEHTGYINLGDIGHFRLADGTIVTNTAEIDRGYKAGYDMIQTAGRGDINGGGAGGNGATGGEGGSSNCGGGGGSGFQDGSVNVVDTGLGGSTGTAKVVIRLAL